MHNINKIWAHPKDPFANTMLRDLAIINVMNLSSARGLWHKLLWNSYITNYVQEIKTVEQAEVGETSEARNDVAHKMPTRADFLDKIAPLWHFPVIPFLSNKCISFATLFKFFKRACAFREERSALQWAPLKRDTVLMNENVRAPE